MTTSTAAAAMVTMAVVAVVVVVVVAVVVVVDKILGSRCLVGEPVKRVTSVSINDRLVL